MNSRGFSLIELIISVAILAVFSSGIVIWFLGYQRQSELDSTAKMIVGTLRDAESRSMSGKDFKNWGVYFDAAGNKYVLFRDDGGGYATSTVREENYISSFSRISSVTLNGGGNEVIFNKAGGDTNQYGNANGNNTAVKIEQSGVSGNYTNIIISPIGRIESQ